MDFLVSPANTMELADTSSNSGINLTRLARHGKDVDNTLNNNDLTMGSMGGRMRWQSKAVGRGILILLAPHYNPISIISSFHELGP